MECCHVVTDIPPTTSPLVGDELLSGGAKRATMTHWTKETQQYALQSETSTGCYLLELCESLSF